MTNEVSGGEGGTEFVYSETDSSMGVVETNIEMDGTPGDSEVVASTGNSDATPEPANDNG